MDNVRDDVAKLLKTATPVVPTVEVKTYEVITTIPVYISASDAKTKKNAKGTIAAGTYYIYTKYPDGVNGMLNISKDKTGKSAGSWINPEENVAPVKEEVAQKLYRVRTSWADAKSQKGAFAALINAKECCQKAGEGYKVYDWNGTEVYSYVASEDTERPTEPEKENVADNAHMAVYDYEFPQTHPIIESGVATQFDKNTCTKAIVAIKKNYADFDINIAKAFFTIAPKYDINPARAIAQSILETGWFKFKNSSVSPEQHNYCGLGATGNGAAGAAFDTIENGVRAQLQHLYAYGCKLAIPADEQLVDPRFKYVTRGIAPYWEQLAGRWAIPGFDGDDADAAVKAGNTYGQKINRLYETIMATTVTDEAIAQYFAAEADEDSKQDAVVDNTNDPVVEPELEEKLDIEKINFVMNLLEKVLKFIIDFFKKKQE